MEDCLSDIFTLKRTKICRQQQQKSILHGCKVSQYNLERQGNYKCILALERYPLELGVTYQSNTKYYQRFMISEDKTDNYSQQTLNSHKIGLN